MSYLPLIFFIYGLAFFCMGLAIVLEVGRGSEHRLRKALMPLAVFGLLHGIHEWLEMFDMMDVLPLQNIYPQVWEIIMLAILVISFLSLAQFGAFQLVPVQNSLLRAVWIPVGMLIVWGVGLILWWSIYPHEAFLNIANVWTRYALAIPGALLASAGLIKLQQTFRQAGMAGFSQDALWAAIALFWYGMIGQVFVRASLLPPSNLINQGLFLNIFGFPIQLVRTAAAVVVAIFVMRFLRSFDVETQRRIDQLQAARLEEAQRREALRGDMLHRVVVAQETERQRIARELHDETGQSLTAIGMGLRGASSTIQHDPEKAAHTLRQLEGLTAASLSELRRIIADLRPSHLDDLGLAAALRWYANEVETRTGLHIQVETSGEARPLPSELTTTLFRITQEALNNVVRHAQASKAMVRLCYCPEGVRIEVEDDGQGFNPDHIDRWNRSSFGLLGMSERAALIGGSVQIDSRPGKGTKVLVGIPYPDSSGGEQ
jgi:signal transduction histidine kinase